MQGDAELSEEALAAQARLGDSLALEQLVQRLQGKIYRLALRMIWSPEDARDATQEILIRIVTNLATFRGDSSFSTWAYRVASNHLLTVRKSRMEEQAYRFDRFGRELEENLSEPYSPEDALLLEEIKIGCTLGMLQCLDRPLRLAYILGEILELDHREAAAALDVSPAVYRKRLSRARGIIVSFMKSRCGLVEPSNACRCSRRVDYAIRIGRVDPRRPLFASSAASAFRGVLNEIRKLEDGRRAAALYRSAHDPVLPPAFTARIQDLLSGMR